MKAPNQLELDALSNAAQASIMQGIGAARARDAAFAAQGDNSRFVEAVCLTVVGIGCVAYTIALALGA